MKTIVGIVAVLLSIFALVNHSFAVSRIFADGFEDGTVDAWGTSGTKATAVSQGADTTACHSGSYCAESNHDCETSYGVDAFGDLTKSGLTYTSEIFYRFWMRIDTDVDAVDGSKMFRIGVNNSIDYHYNGISFNTGLWFDYWNLPGVICYGLDDIWLNKHDWYKIEIYIKDGAAADGSIRMWVDDQVLNCGGSNLGHYPFDNYTTTREAAQWDNWAWQSNWSCGAEHEAWDHDANNHFYLDDVEIFSDAGSDSVTGTMAGGDIAYVGADTTDPVLSDLTPSGAQSCSSDPRNVTETLTTDETATCRAHDTNNTWATMTEMSTTGGTTHSRTVSRACNSSWTPYYMCQDAALNESAASQGSYSVSAAVAAAIGGAGLNAAQGPIGGAGLSGTPTGGMGR